jgi:hypothetical protein
MCLLSSCQAQDEGARQASAAGPAAPPPATSLPLAAAAAPSEAGMALYVPLGVMMSCVLLAAIVLMLWWTRRLHAEHAAAAAADAAAAAAERGEPRSSLGEAHLTPPLLPWPAWATCSAVPASLQRLQSGMPPSWRARLVPPCAPCLESLRGRPMLCVQSGSAARLCCRKSRSSSCFRTAPLFRSGGQSNATRAATAGTASTAPHAAAAVGWRGGRTGPKRARPRPRRSSWLRPEPVPTPARRRELRAMPASSVLHLPLRRQRPAPCVRRGPRNQLATRHAVADVRGCGALQQRSLPLSQSCCSTSVPLAQRALMHPSSARLLLQAAHRCCPSLSKRLTRCSHEGPMLVCRSAPTAKSLQVKLRSSCIASCRSPVPLGGSKPWAAEAVLEKCGCRMPEAWPSRNMPWQGDGSIEARYHQPDVRQRPVLHGHLVSQPFV